MGTEQKRLVSSEYIDLRYLYAAMHVFERMGKHRERFKLNPGSWQSYRSAMGLIEKAAAMLIETVPVEDRARLRADLNNSDIYLHTTRVSAISVDDSDMIFLTRNQMKDVIGYALEGVRAVRQAGQGHSKVQAPQGDARPVYARAADFQRRRLPLVRLQPGWRGRPPAHDRHDLGGRGKTAKEGRGGRKG